MGRSTGPEEAARRIVLGRAVEALRKRRNLTQKEAAEAAGLPYWTPGLWATGKAVRDDQLEQVLVALEASHADLEREMTATRAGRTPEAILRGEQPAETPNESDMRLGARTDAMPEADLTIAEAEQLLRALARRQGLSIDVTYRSLPAEETPILH